MIDCNAAIASLDWSKEPQGLYAPIAYAMGTGGKRLRANLPLLACRLVGGKDEDVLPFALAIEVFHNFTLLHDDVMDKAAVRRGQPTVHVKWNDNTAILSGDQMLIEAYRFIAGVPAQYLPEALQLFTTTATEVCEGQQYDVDFEQRNDVHLDEYIEMIRLKTSVLLAAALKGGALIGGATTQQQNALYEFGIHLGLAFQIQDDLLDCFGDEATFGKAIGGDIACNKKTYLFLTAQANADKEQREAIAHWLQQPASPEKLEGMKALYVATRAREAAEDAIAAHTRQALDCLRVFADSEERKQLERLAEKLSNRQN